MTYELECLEEFIQKEYQSCGSNPPHSTIPEFDKKKELIQAEVERIKKSFRHFLFNTECETLIENVIQHHQQHIIKMADQVVRCIDEAEASEIYQISDGQTKLNLCKIMYKALEELLTFIETFFSKYFNQDEKIPRAYALLASKEILYNLEILEEESRQKNVEAELIRIALFPVKDFAKIQPYQGVRIVHQFSAPSMHGTDRDADLFFELAPQSLLDALALF